MALALAVAACRGEAQAPAPAASASAAVVLEAAGPRGKIPPMRAREVRPNPLELPAQALAVAPEQRVFAVPADMLDGAREGSSFRLAPVVVKEVSGDDLVVETPLGASYRVHSAYVIAPAPRPRFARPRTPVLVEYGGHLRAGLVVRQDKDRVLVRLTDDGARSSEVWAGPSALLGPAPEGLGPGAFAAAALPEGPSRVLLVSSHTKGTVRRWLALGYAGAARIVSEGSLVPMPITYSPKKGEAVLALADGKLRLGAVASTPETGLFGVEFERSGPNLLVGAGGLVRADVLPLLDPKRAPPPAPTAPKPKRKTLL
jgi:hypothetical protein